MNTTIAQQIADEGGVEAYLHAQQYKSLLRFLTCGSVDDGKSTLIGRLLHDTRQIYEDQLSSCTMTVNATAPVAKNSTRAAGGRLAGGARAGHYH